MLIDDVVTRGATLLGCANRLADAFPQCRIRAFAAMRTISNSNEFENVYCPCIGAIDLVGTGDTFRRHNSIVDFGVGLELLSLLPYPPLFCDVVCQFVLYAVLADACAPKGLAMKAVSDCLEA